MAVENEIDLAYLKDLDGRRHFLTLDALLDAQPALLIAVPDRQEMPAPGEIAGEDAGARAAVPEAEARPSPPPERPETMREAARPSPTGDVAGPPRPDLSAPEELVPMRPATLAEPRNGVPDNLQRIRGVGERNEARLNRLGMFVGIGRTEPCLTGIGVTA